MKYFHRKQSAELGLTMMLVAVVTVFFICNLLAFLVNILEVNKEHDIYFILSYSFFLQHCSIFIYALAQINNFLVTLNSSINFIIYCIFGQKFRRTFLKMFTKSRCREKPWTYLYVIEVIAHIDIAYYTFV